MRQILVVVTVLLVVSCTSSSVPAMRFTRFSAVAANHYPAFDRSVDDAVVAGRVHDAVRALPAAPKGRFCPADHGLRYRLSFNEAARVVLSVVVEGTGCAEVIFSDTDRRATDDAFWDLLADALAVRRADIFFLMPDELRR